MARTLGVDLGERRVGFAVSDPDGILATPHSVAHVRSREEAVAAAASLVKDAEAEAVVVGWPVNMDGSHGPATETVKRFVEDLRERVSVPIETWDERLTTKSAMDVLAVAGTRRERREKNVVDKLAAQIMLQHYLDAHEGVE